MRSLGLVLILASLVGCDGTAPTDGGVAPSDAGVATDAGPSVGMDAGAIDAGAIDAGATDAGATDASHPDAWASDAGAPDAAAADSGSIDAGTLTAPSVCEALCRRLTECVSAPPDEFAACLSDCGADLVDCSDAELGELHRCSTASDACMIDPMTMAPKLSLCIGSVGCVRG